MSIAMQEWPRRHRITVEHYYRMGEAGLFEPDERVELIDGEIVDMPPVGARHASSVARLVDLITSAVGRRAMVRCQLPVRLGEISELQPDVSIVASRSDYYALRHPVAADVLLLVELSDATLRFDRDIKAPLYARHGVAETWVIDLAAERIHTFRAPVDGRYTIVEAELGVTTIAALPGVTVDLRGLRAPQSE